ncbi:MAG: CotH kinase family protein [Flavobacteriales bacterium]
MNIVRCIPLAVALTSALAGSAQRVVINELQCAGEGPDRVELLNTGERPADLSGLRFSLNERTATLEQHVILGANERSVIVFGKAADADPPHIGFGLPSTGGTLLLISADGSSILDLFTWPAMPAGVSIGRQPDGGTGWSFFSSPSFGIRNAPEPTLRAVSAPPQAQPPGGIVAKGSLIEMGNGKGTSVRFIRDGSEPTEQNGFNYTAPIAIEDNTVIRARSFAEGALPSTTFTGTYITTLLSTPWVAVSGSPPDGRDKASSDGTVELFGFSAPGICEVRLRESGSGSRSFPKRNLKLEARGHGKLPWPGLDEGNEAILRADATPHAFLRNRFMECVVKATGSHVDVQASLPVELYLDGDYRGLYRWMPPKDEDWLCTVHHYEALDVLHGPSLRKVDGDRKHFHAAYEALLDGAQLDTLETLIDVPSLIDLACFDLWTGRADHDLNVRCWRPKVPDGKWRWVLYDMDLWAPADDNSLARMCAEAAPVAPYLPQLLHAPTMRDRLLARMSALLATVLANGSARAAVDSLYRVHADALVRDHSRWSGEMEMPAPAEARDALFDFFEQRGPHVFEQLSERTGLGLRTITVAADPRSGGHVEVEDLPLPALPARLTAFSGVPLRLKAVAAEGFEFAGWKQLEGSDVITIDPRKTHKLTAVFRRTGTSSHHRLQESGEDRLAIGVP